MVVIFSLSIDSWHSGMELIKSTIQLSVQRWFEAHWLFPLTFCERRKNWSNNYGGNMQWLHNQMPMLAPKLFDSFYRKFYSNFKYIFRYMIGFSDAIEKVKFSSRSYNWFCMSMQLRITFQTNLTFSTWFLSNRMEVFLIFFINEISRKTQPKHYLRESIIWLNAVWMETDFLANNRHYLWALRNIVQRQWTLCWCSEIRICKVERKTASWKHERYTRNEN